jgi:hypothetical protein
MNPVKHGLITDASNYPFCSYKWFIEQGNKELKQQVLAQPIDRLKLLDDF